MVQQQLQILLKGVMDVARRLVECPDRLFREAFAGTLDEIVCPSLVVARSPVVVARASDQREPPLRSLSECTQESHLAHRMASHPFDGSHGSKRVWACIKDDTPEGGDADVRSRVPNPHLHPRSLVELKYLLTGGIKDGLQPHPHLRLLRGRLATKQRDSVSFNALAKAVGHGLDRVVPRRKAIRAHHKAPAAGGKRQGVVRVNQLVGEPDGVGAVEVDSLNPQYRSVRVKGAYGDERQLFDSD